MTRIYATAACGVAQSANVYSSQVATGIHAPALKTAVSVIACASVFASLSSEAAMAWSTPDSMSSSAIAAVSAPTDSVSYLLAQLWASPVPLQNSSRFNVAAADYSVNTEGRLRVHQAAPHEAELQTPQLGTDVYTIRPSEYDLRQSELLTDVSSAFNLSDGPYIPSPVVRIASFDLTDLPAYPIRSGAAFSVHTPPNKFIQPATPWGFGEPRFARPDLPYKVEPPLLPGAPVLEPDIRETYISMNSVNVVALPGNEPLAVSDVKLDLDKKSAAWKCSFSVLNSASAALIEPTAAGQKEVAITINGWRWECFIDSVPESKSFSGDTLNHRYTASGYSRSQYLGVPYAPLRSASAASTTAVQAVTDELLGTGFALDWNTARLPDWTMASSAFSYQGLTPLQVITKMATAVGAIVQPGMSTDTIKVAPEFYPLPWDLASSTPDHSISEHQIETFDKTRVFNTLINAVRVSGEQDVSGAVVLDVTRAGTAGDTFGDDVSDAWLTSFDANKSRGAQAIAASGVRMRYTLSTAVPESISTEPGIILPGQTLAVIYDDTAQSFRAYVDSVSISAQGNGLADVTQTVVLDRPIEWEA